MTQMLQINRTHSLTRLRWLKGDPRRAIGDDAIVCLVCGYALRQLTNTHLRLHGLTAPVYRERFGYNRCRP
ncbi:MAG TPA: MucR family transcriptional regulator, partial [Methylomirabilota bacterium]